MKKTTLSFYQLRNRNKTSFREKREDKFDTSAVGDLAFLLLIFFIVTSSFILRQGIFLSLPSGKSGKTHIDKKEILKVTPTQLGFKIKGEDVSRVAFKSLLIEHKKNYAKGVVMIQMPINLPYDRMIDTLSAVKESGLLRISIKSVKG